MVVGHRIGESRERGCLGVGTRRIRVETEVGDRVYLKDRIAGAIAENRGVRWGVRERCGNVPAKDLSGVL